MTAQDAEKLIHELQVHQIELEIQNKDLRSTQLALEEAREKYFDLYNLAPVGYISLNEDEVITDANPTAADLFGIERNILNNKPLTRLILREDQDIYYVNSKKLIDIGEKQQFDIRMKRKDKTSFWAHIVSVLSKKDYDSFTIRITISGITNRKRAEERLKESEKS